MADDRPKQNTPATDTEGQGAPGANGPAAATVATRATVRRAAAPEAMRSLRMVRASWHVRGRGPGRSRLLGRRPRDCRHARTGGWRGDARSVEV